MREPEGLGVLRTVWRAKVRVRQREVHVRELERLWVSHTVQEQEVHVREQEVHVRELGRLWVSHTVRELGPLLGAVTRQVHTVLLQRTLLKSLTSTLSGSFRNAPIVPMILSMCQS